MCLSDLHKSVRWEALTVNKTSSLVEEKMGILRCASIKQISIYN